MAHLPRLNRLLVFALLVQLVVPLAPIRAGVASSTRASAFPQPVAAAAVEPAAAPAVSGALLGPSQPEHPPQIPRPDELLFVENVGQFDPAERFRVLGSTGVLHLATGAVWFTAVDPGDLAKSEDPRAYHVKLSFAGANSSPRLVGLNAADVTLSYFQGDATQWRPAVPVWRNVRYVDLYPGIDLELSSQDGAWVWRLVVRDSAQLPNVRLQVAGAQALAVNGRSILMSTPLGNYAVPLLELAGNPGDVQSGPTVSGSEVLTPFAPAEGATGGSALAPSSIPPEVTPYFKGSYLGGSDNDWGTGIDVDRNGNVYVTGYTWSSNFPNDPGYQPPYRGHYDAFVTSFDGAFTRLRYSAILGGTNEDRAYDIVANDHGEAWLTGFTGSTDFPTTSGAFDGSCSSVLTVRDAFFARLSASGTSLAYSSCLGGSGADGARTGSDESVMGIALDATGRIYVTSDTSSPDFPTTPNAYHPGPYQNSACSSGEDAFLFIIAPPYGPGDQDYGTYLGGTGCDHGNSLVVDPAGEVYLTGFTNSTDFATTTGAYSTTLAGGWDGWVAKIRPGGEGPDDLVYGSYLGGSSDEKPTSLDVDLEEHAYVFGRTDSSNFPTTPGVISRTLRSRDLFVTKFEADGSALSYSTFFGTNGSDGEGGSRSLRVDGQGNAYIAAGAGGLGLPVTENAFQSAPSDDGDAFIAKLNPTASAVLYATYVGGDGPDHAEHAEAIAIDASGQVYLTGATQSSDFPTSPGAPFGEKTGETSWDAFVFKVAILPLPDELLWALAMCQAKRACGDVRACCVMPAANGYAVYFGGDPANTRSGEMSYVRADLTMPALGGPLVFERIYSSQALEVYTTTLGYGWTHNHDIRLIRPTDPGGVPGEVLAKLQGPARLIFFINIDGSYSPYPGVAAELAEVGAGYRLTTTQQYVYTFDAQARLTEWSDGRGHTWTYSYDTLGRLERVEDSSPGRYLTFGYDGNSQRLATVHDPIGRDVEFGYDASGDLVSVRDLRGQVWTYLYEGTTHRLREVRDPLDHSVENVGYDAQGRVITQANGLGEPTLTIDFHGLGPEVISGTRTVTEAQHSPITVTYDTRGTVARLEDARGYTQTRSLDGGFRPDRLVDQQGHGTAIAWSDRGPYPTEIVDASGNLTLFSHDVFNNVTQTVDARGLTTTLSYSGTLLTAKIDALGNRWSYTYTNGLLTAEQSPRGAVTRYAVDAYGQRVSATGALSHTTRYEYDPVGRLITTTDTLGRLTVNAYDDGDLLVQVTRNYTNTGGGQQNYLDEFNLVTRFGYDLAGRQVLVTDTLGLVTYTEYDDAGRAIRVTRNYSPELPLNADNQYNLVTLTEYDAAGHIILSTDPAGRVTRTWYDDLGRVISATQNYSPTLEQNAWGVYNLVTRYAYDAVGNRILVTDTLGQMTRTWYDLVNRPISVTQNYSPTHGLSERGEFNLITYYGYDGLNNQVVVTDTVGRVTRSWYDELNRPISVTQNYTTTTSEQNYLSQYNLTMWYEYDADGRRVAVTDTLERATWTEYDVLGRVLTETNAAGEETNYRYDALGSRVALTDALRHRTDFAYDTLGRLVTTTRWLGTTPVTDVLHYDALGRRVEAIDALGHSTYYGHDALGRQIVITDATGYTRTLSYDVLGQVLVERDGLGNPVSYEYDVAGRRTRIMDAEGNATGYGYDALSHRVVVTDANEVVTRYGYDTLGRPISVTENYEPGAAPDHETNILTRYLYDALGNRIALNNSRGYTTTYAYDALSRLVTITDPLTHTTSFLYDPVGRRSVVTDANGEVSLYGYDLLDRLTVITYTADATTVRYSYDAVGNRLAMTDTLGVTQYTYDDLYRLTQVQDPYNQTVLNAYDRAGNRMRLTYPGGSVVTYTYDAANRLVSVLDWNRHSTQYAYDRAGRLVTTTLPNGVSSVNSYDRAGRVVQLSHTRGATLLGRYVYELDEVGNRVAVTETIARPAWNVMTQTVVYTVTASADDANAFAQGMSMQTVVTGTYLEMGASPARAAYAGYRFGAVTLPDGAQLSRADLRLTGFSDAKPVPELLRVYGEAADVAQAYSTSENFTWRDLTLQSSPWGLTEWYADEVYAVDVTAPVNEILARPGWQSGNPVALQVWPESADGFVRARSYDGSATQAARLALTYTVPVWGSPQLVTTTLHYAYDPLSRLVAADDHDAQGLGLRWDYDYDAAGNRTAMTETLTRLTGNVITQTAVFTVSLSAEDAYIYNDESIDTDGAFVMVGTQKDARNTAAGLRFGEVLLPEDAEVFRADLRVVAYDAEQQMTALLYGEAADAAEPYSTYADFVGRELTPQAVERVIGGWKPGERYSVDVTAVVTEVLARPGWVSGNPVALQVWPEEQQELYAQVWSVDGGASSAAELALWYTVPETAQVVTATTYTYDAANRLVTVDETNLIWDDNGNLLQYGGTTYAYDQANRLISATVGVASTQIAYNGDGARLRQAAGSAVVTYTLDSAAPMGQVLVKRSGAGTTRYLYGMRRIGEQQGWQWVYYLSDGLASVRQLANASGQVTLARGYKPFGEPWWSQGPGSSVYGYAGQAFDAGLGLIYFGYGQYYDPATGRLLSPAGTGANPYLPYSRPDPLGALLGPLALLVLVARKRRKGRYDHWVVLGILVIAVGTGLAACGGAQTPPPPTPTGEPTVMVTIYTPTPGAPPSQGGGGAPVATIAVPATVAGTLIPTLTCTPTPVPSTIPFGPPLEGNFIFENPTPAAPDAELWQPSELPIVEAAFTSAMLTISSPIGFGSLPSALQSLGISLSSPVRLLRATNYPGRPDASLSAVKPVVWVYDHFFGFDPTTQGQLPIHEFAHFWDFDGRFAAGLQTWVNWGSTALDYGETSPSEDFATAFEVYFIPGLDENRLWTDDLGAGLARANDPQWGGRGKDGLRLNRAGYLDPNGTIQVQDRYDYIEMALGRPWR